MRTRLSSAWVGPLLSSMAYAAVSTLSPAAIAGPPHCGDGVMNVGESDVDCGGACAPCAGGKHCNTNVDCEGGHCDAAQGNVCQPKGLDHVAELQIEVAELEGILTAGFRALRDDQICGLPSIPCPLGGGACVIEDVTFPGPLSLRRSDQTSITNFGGFVFFHPVQAVLPVTVRMKNADCLDPTTPGAACAPDDVASSPTVQVVFDLSPLVDSNGAVQVCASLNTVLPLAGVTLPPELTQPQCLPIGQLSMLSSGLDSPITHILASDDPDESRLAVRLWFDDEPPPALMSPAFDDSGTRKDTVEPFLNGVLAPSPAGSRWSAYVGGRLFADLTGKKLFDLASPLAANEGFPISPGTEHMSLPDTVWLGAAGFAGSTINLGLRADFSSCAAEAILTADVAFSLDQGEIRVKGKLNEDVGVYECWYAIFVDGLAEPVIDYLLPNETFAVSLFANASCSANPAEKSFLCTLPAASPSIQPFTGGPSLQIVATSLTGTPQGLVVGGPVTQTALAPEKALSIDSQGFFETTRGCHHAPNDPWTSTFTVLGSGELCGAPTVVGDPAGYVITDKAPWTSALPHEFEVTTLLSPSELGPFTVLVRTTSGIGELTIAAPVADKCDDWPCQVHEASERFEACYLEEDGWLGIPGRWDPHWAIDPMVREGTVIVDGERQSVEVLFSNVHVSSTGPARRERQEGGSFSLSQHEVRMTANVVVRGERLRSSFIAPVTIDMVLDMDGLESREVRGFVALTTAGPARAVAEARPDDLPRGVEALGLELRLDRGDLTLYGMLPAE